MIEDLLIPIRITDASDSQEYTNLLIHLEYALAKNPTEPCTIFIMSPKTGRERSFNDDGTIGSNLFQGPHPADGSIYPGDESVLNTEQVSVQIHRLDLTKDIADRKETFKKDVIVLAIRIPKRLAVGWVTQI